MRLLQKKVLCISCVKGKNFLFVPKITEVLSCLPDVVVTINSSDSAKCLNNILQSLLEESFMERNGKLLTNDCFKVTLTVCNADILVYTFLICAFLSFICYRIPWRYMYAYSIVNCLCLKFPAHYRSRFKEMGTHLHKEPQGWSLCV